MTAASQDSFMFTVGKLDAGMAILLGERAHLIEFPSLLLPPGVTTGSIVNIAVQRNTTEEKKRENDFWDLQHHILDAFGTHTPQHPKLELRNVTQTSVTLEWPRLQLATAKLRSLDLYRDRQRVAAIPSPTTNTSTKVSGLQLDTEYTFQLVLRTTAGLCPSNQLTVRTHTMTDTSGISVCFGTVEDELMLENAKIDTTHFVCTTPAATPTGANVTNSIATGPGVEYQKALQLSIPVVQPQWILACHADKKMMPIRPFYLGEHPSSPSHFRPQSMSQATLPSPSQRSSTSSPTQQKAANRQSMPPQREPETGEDEDEDQPGRTRKGTMSKNFKFPPASPSQPPPPVPSIPDIPPTISVTDVDDAPQAPSADAPQTPPKVESGHAPQDLDSDLTPVAVVTPSSVQVPPPPPVDKERPLANGNDLDDDVGETEEISLN
ncbi:uncharacterized protein BXZ73DRAFT_108217 [Epithele typhae]|uniref:uncharacterized protein n=1 Tax=Epithele typhae TaxID=378194 RepID=UPI0020081B08|nr:uncharacterized protein BXZ73DRAFT_108217 [Epithele typhae]KAH9911141.1 hypothetical protein BXZ73DRAFT_108217 [Epithele typhae]